MAVGGDVRKTRAFNANIGVLHYWSAQWRWGLQANYLQLNYDGAVARAGLADDWKAGNMAANLIWSPVKKLDIGAEIFYAKNLKKADVGYTGPKDADAWVGRLRVQRDF